MKSWQTLLESAQAIKGETNGQIYEQTKILIRIYQDKEFQAEMERTGQGDGSDYLSVTVNHTFANFTQLREIMNIYPNKQDWLTGDLVSMKMKTDVSIRLGKKTNKPDKKESKESEETMGWKDRCLEAEKQNLLLKEQIKFLKGEVRRLNGLVRAFGKSPKGPKKVA